MKIFIDIAIAVAVGLLLLFVYNNYWDDIRWTLFNEQPAYTIYVGNVALSVSVADTPDEQKQGLSGVTDLANLEGKLFIFDNDARHGIWMKDMLLPLDIMWFNSELELIYYQKDVLPSSYPTVFSPPENARFVLETNAKLIESLNIDIGYRLTLPPTIIPGDIKIYLQQ